MRSARGQLTCPKIEPVLGVAIRFSAGAGSRPARALEVDQDTASSAARFVVSGSGARHPPLGWRADAWAPSRAWGCAAEDLTIDDVGRLTNASLLDYRKLTAADCPIETIIRTCLTVRDLRRPRCGREAHIPAPAAMANAIQDATGVASRSAAKPGSHRTGLADQGDRPGRPRRLGSPHEALPHGPKRTRGLRKSVCLRSKKLCGPQRTPRVSATRAFWQAAANSSTALVGCPHRAPKMAGPGCIAGHARWDAGRTDSA